jgi:hypothetical protein
MPRTPIRRNQTRNTETSLGMWNLSRNFTMGLVTMARKSETVKGTTTEEVIFSTAAQRITAITARRKNIALPELK